MPRLADHLAADVVAVARVEEGLAAWSARRRRCAAASAAGRGGPVDGDRPSAARASYLDDRASRAARARRRTRGWRSVMLTRSWRPGRRGTPRLTQCTSSGAPTRRSSIAAFSSDVAGVEPAHEPERRAAPRRRRADLLAATRTHSASVGASGFSQSTGLPARTAATDEFGMRRVVEAMTTASTLGRRSAQPGRRWPRRYAPWIDGVLARASSTSATALNATPLTNGAGC